MPAIVDDIKITPIAPGLSDLELRPFGWAPPVTVKRPPEHRVEISLRVIDNAKLNEILSAIAGAWHREELRDR